MGGNLDNLPVIARAAVTTRVVGGGVGVGNAVRETC